MYRAGSGRDWRQAIDLFKEAARLFERVGNRRRHLETLSLLSIAMLHHGDLSNAIEIRKQVYELACTHQDPQMQGIALIELGEAALRSAEVLRAAELLERARSLEEHAGSVDRIWMYGMLAAARVRLGDPESAAKAAASGWKCVTPDQPPAFYILDGLSGLAEAEISRWLARPSQECRARIADVLRLLRKFSRSFPIARPRALLWTGVMASIEKDGKRARKLWKRGRTLAREMKMPYDESILAAQFEYESAFLRWNLDLPATESDSREDGKIVAGR
jgi:tetratricopeptide (TPR) repeat protein